MVSASVATSRGDNHAQMRLARERCRPLVARYFAVPLCPGLRPPSVEALSNAGARRTRG